MKSSCELCFEIQSGRMPAQHGSRLRHHVPVGSALIFAALTPLRAGHVLVIPREHTTSTAALAPAARDDVADALALLARSWCDPGRRLLTFEHGIRPGDDGGCGIAHAHVHALDVSDAEHERIIAAARTLPGEQTWEGPARGDELAHESYVHVGDWQRGTGFGATGEFPSQTLRRLVAPQLGSDRVDWRVSSGWDDLHTTDRALVQRFPSAVGSAVGHAG